MSAHQKKRPDPEHKAKSNVLFCTFCREEIKEFPFTCKFCGFHYCGDHRLPENHECIGLETYKEKQKVSLSSGASRPEKPIEYFYGKKLPVPETSEQPQGLNLKSIPLVPALVIAAGVICMIAGYFANIIVLYYVGFIVICAGFIRFFQKRAIRH